MNDMKELAELCWKKCQDNEWNREWHNASFYLHTEAVEFTEAIKGNRGQPGWEAADLFFVILSTLEAHNVDVRDVLEMLKIKYDLK